MQVSDLPVRPVTVIAPVLRLGETADGDCGPGRVAVVLCLAGGNLRRVMYEMAAPLNSVKVLGLEAETPASPLLYYYLGTCLLS